MIKRSAFILLIPVVILSGIFFSSSASAQDYYQFLGPPRIVQDRFSPKFGIRYNTRGYDQPHPNWAKKIRKMQKKKVPDWAIDQVLSFPGSTEAIGQWIDERFERVRSQFQACGGTLAQRARTVSPRGLSVTIMDSAFRDPYYNVDVAGVYYPSSREIRVLNIYYQWGGPNKGWLRHAKDLLEWEIGNFFAVETRVQPEPRPAGWPCNAPPLR
jgi:hypothetical protein